MKAPLRGALAGAAAALLAGPASAGAVDLPMVLPGDGAATAAAVGGRWIVGARPGAAARALARRFGARHVGPPPTGGYVIARGRARAFARALRQRGLLVYAQPDALAHTLQSVPNDPLSVPPDDWRAKVASPAIAPPPVTPASPLIALVDTQLALPHAEFAGGNVTTLTRLPVTSSHGTATASVAAAPVNGRGIVGVWPGARALNVPVPEAMTCGQSADGIATAIRRGAAVVNMSYGSAGVCVPEYVALQYAVALGIVPVAAAGNEFTQGDPLEFPASLPHVLTVAALAPDLSSSLFSSTSGAIDVSAPGERIMTAVPPALDTDGVNDGYQRQSGTSFAAPMVSAAVAWVRARRPELTADQAAQAVRLSATDLGLPGWQRDTGYGLLSVGAALTVTPPPPDPAEPNDDIVWVDGRAFGKPDRLFYRGKRRAALFALLDVFEDPADVYRVRLRPHSRVKVRANPLGDGDVSLAIYRRKAKRLSSRPLRRSAHRGRRTERLALRNRSARPRTYYVAVTIRRGRLLDAGYVLRVA